MLRESCNHHLYSLSNLNEVRNHLATQWITIYQFIQLFFFTPHSLYSCSLFMFPNEHVGCVFYFFLFIIYLFIWLIAIQLPHIWLPCTLRIFGVSSLYVSCGNWTPHLLTIVASLSIYFFAPSSSSFKIIKRVFFAFWFSVLSRKE